MNLSFIKKIDFLKILFLIAVSAIFFMYSTSYYHNCFPNCYAWKEMMIKWSDGDFVRRGLLGTVFYALEPTIPIKFSAVFFNYVCVLFCSYVIYYNLHKLDLPKWIFVSIIFSPSLILFNLHPTLVLRKDIVSIAGCLLILILIKFYWDRISLKRKTISIKDCFVFILIYCYVFSFILLCFEVFIVFVPFLSLYTFYVMTRNFSIRLAVKVSLLIGVISFFLFFALTIPYVGDEVVVSKIVMDWYHLYPNLRVFVDGLTKVNSPPDPFTFLMMTPEQYKNHYLYINSITNYFELVLVYILMIVPLSLMIKFKLVCVALPLNIDFWVRKHKIVSLLVVLVTVHFPILLSLVAFDYGRWLVLSFYLMVFFVCFFTEKNQAVSFRQSYLSSAICWFVSILYVIAWMPHHWAGEGFLISFGNFDLFKNLFVFYSNFNYTYGLLFN